MREGGCFCGAIRYRLDGEPRAVGICHCDTCRRVASSASLPFATFERARFAFVQGEPASLHSSPTVIRRFCGRCGSPLTYEASGDPGVLDVVIGSLDDSGTVQPSFHVWMREKLGWDIPGDGLPAHEQSRTSV